MPGGFRSILAARAERSFGSVADFIRRTKLSRRDRHTLASAGAPNALAETRRQALWGAARADLEFDLFANASTLYESDRLLAPMTIVERIQADFATVGLTSGDHQIKHRRPNLPDLWRADELALAKNGTRVREGRSLICRQRPGTAKGAVFVSSEGETGIANGVLYADVFRAHRLVVTQNSALILEGLVQVHDRFIHVKADRVSALRSTELPEQASRDFY